MIEILKVVKAYSVFKVAPALLDLADKLRDIGLEVDKQIGWLNKLDHGVENVEVTLVVTFADVPGLPEISREDVGIFINSAVLNSCFLTLTDFIDLTKPAIEKINLQVKCPPGHVFIKIPQVWIAIH
jgi:hypothetical protein